MEFLKDGQYIHSGHDISLCVDNLEGEYRLLNFGTAFRGLSKGGILICAILFLGRGEGGLIMNLPCKWHKRANLVNTTLQCGACTKMGRGDKFF